MTLILAVDLAWSGPSGWVAWDAEKDDPLIDYGDFAPTDKHKGACRTQHIGCQIYAKLVGVLDKHYPDLLAYEITDWHQALTGAAEEWRKRYARERLTQRCLGRAEMVLLMAAHEHGVTPLEMGTNQVKDQFGAQRKDAVAHLLAAEYPKRLRWQEDSDGGSPLYYLIDLRTGQPISHHVSDAMAIAKVAADNLRQAELHSQ